MRGHDGVHSGCDRGAERLQLHRLDAIVIGIQPRERQMAILGRVAVPGEMLSRHQHGILSIRMRAGDVSLNEARYLSRVLAKRSNVDDRIVGVVIDVGHRGEQPVDAHRARVASGIRPFLTHGRQIMRGGKGHAVRPRRGGVHSHGSASLEIRGDEQRRLGHPL